MNWKKAAKIAAMTAIPGGLVAFATWKLVKKLRSREAEKPRVNPSEQNHRQHVKEADDVHAISNQ